MKRILTINPPLACTALIPCYKTERFIHEVATSCLSIFTALDTSLAPVKNTLGVQATWKLASTERSRVRAVSVWRTQRGAWSGQCRQYMMTLKYWSLYSLGLKMNNEQIRKISIYSAPLYSANLGLVRILLDPLTLPIQMYTKSPLYSTNTTSVQCENMYETQPTSRQKLLQSANILY